MRVCSWCLEDGRDPHMGGPQFAPPHMVTHGICQECLRRECPDLADTVILEVENKEIER